MSTLYNLEPTPTAKVLLQTTAGDILLSLFGAQCPLATRSFIQHCLNGYYDNTLFHRLIPSFILQGGDPTGTGSGGQSALDGGEPFADEFHSRLKFNRRGLLGMAGSERNDNGSQFFITLGPTPELQGKNTLFGRVEGDTIFNVLKMAEGELAEEEGDRPLYPYRVTRAEVLVNPFEDVVRNVAQSEKVAKGGKKPKERDKKKRKVGKGILSFGGEEGEEEGDLLPVTKSKKPKYNPKLVEAAVGDGHDAKMSNEKKQSPSPAERKQNGSRPTTQDNGPSPPPAAPRPAARQRSASASSSTSYTSSPSPEPSTSRSTARLDRTNAQIAELKASMRRDVDSRPHANKSHPKSALESMIPENAKRGRKRGTGGARSDDPEALKLFNAFSSKMGSNSLMKPSRDDVEDGKAGRKDGKGVKEGQKNVVIGDEDEEAALCDLHFIANCQSCTKWDEHDAAEDELADDKDLWSHTLSFAKDRLGKDLEWKRKMEHELVVIDPKEKSKEIHAEEKRARKERARDKDKDRKKKR